MEWISVDDKMPDETGEQDIVCYVDYHGNRCVCVGIFENAKVKGADVKRWRDVKWNIIRQRITHWMPLPEPPEE